MLLRQVSGAVEEALRRLGRGGGRGQLERRGGGFRDVARQVGEAALDRRRAPVGVGEDRAVVLRRHPEEGVDPRHGALGVGGAGLDQRGTDAPQEVGLGAEALDLAAALEGAEHAAGVVPAGVEPLVAVTDATGVRDEGRQHRDPVLGGQGDLLLEDLLAKDDHGGTHPRVAGLPAGPGEGLDGDRDPDLLRSGSTFSPTHRWPARRRRRASRGD